MLSMGVLLWVLILSWCNTVYVEAQTVAPKDSLRHVDNVPHPYSPVPTDSLPKPLLPPLLRPQQNLGLQVRGRMGLNAHIVQQVDDNPALPENLRRRSSFVFKEEADIHAELKYGERLKMLLDYNTESSFNARRRNLNLSYTGDETDLIKTIEVGNIHPLWHNPFIDTGTTLFGLRSVVGYGPLTIQAIASRREGNRRTITVHGGGMLTHFDLKGSDYDEGRHFFLSEYFANHYEEWLQEPPGIRSPLKIERIEVYVASPQRLLQGSVVGEQIIAYSGIITDGRALPQNDGATGIAVPLENARRLDPSGYLVNEGLGLLSLRTPLAQDETLAVAYEYRYNGRLYRVGAFAAEGSNKPEAALLAERNKQPGSPVWSLMMRNAYALPASGNHLSEQDIRVRIAYRSYGNEPDHFFPEGNKGNVSWLTLMGLDRVDTNRATRPDGRFDYLPGITLSSELGVIFMPYRRPLDEVVQRVDPSENHYLPFPDLYDKSKYDAQQEADRDRFVISGDVKNSGMTTISLGTSGLQPGDIQVKVGGRLLREESDYRVNYATGDLTITAKEVLASESLIEVSIEERQSSIAKQKNLLGAEANLEVNPHLNLGASLFSYRETLSRARIRWGEEPLDNLLIGAHLDYENRDNHWSDWIHDHLPSVDPTQPSSLTAHAAFARLKAGFNASSEGSKDIVIEDFEHSTSYFTLLAPHAWHHSSIPADRQKENERNEHRARLAWFTIDPLLTENRAEMPAYIRQNAELTEHPYVRDFKVTDLFPRTDLSPLSSQSLPLLNLSFYPDERGLYNVSTTTLKEDGSSKDERTMWGGMMRTLPVQDLKSARIDYLELWLLDPFIAGEEVGEGILQIDLGHLSEDVIGDGFRSYENGLDGPTEETPWGVVPTQTPQLYAFDFSSDEKIERLDIGLNGLSSEQELQHPYYRPFIDRYRGAWGKAPEDPAGDDFISFLDERWDKEQADILTRYKYINGPEGNSTRRQLNGRILGVTLEPDVSDLDKDMEMNEVEAYLSYRLPISREGLRMGSKYVVGERKVSYNTNGKNGKTYKTRWVKVRIPLASPDLQYGGVSSELLRDVRAIRLVCRDFDHPVHLRLAAFRLVRSEWVPYGGPLDSEQVIVNTLPEIGHVGLEEDASRAPIPYVSPSALPRNTNLNEMGTLLEDEQSLSFKFNELPRNGGTAIYRELSHDLRPFDRLKLEVHLEGLPNVHEELGRGELEFFIRLGHDYNDNYYEIAYPLVPTPLGEAPSESTIWPEANSLDLPLQWLTDAKEARGAVMPGRLEMHKEWGYRENTGPYTITLKGFPTLGHVSAVVMGVRNKSGRSVSGEVWVNELRVSGTKHSGGFSVRGETELKIADLTSLRWQFTYLSAGFGSLMENLRALTQGDRRSSDLTLHVSLGKFFPVKWRMQAPLTISHSRHSNTAYYDPYDSDLAYKKHATQRWQEMEDIGRSGEQTFTLALPNVHFAPMDMAPAWWSPENISLSYSHSSTAGHSPELYKVFRRRMTGELAYRYEPAVREGALYNATKLAFAPNHIEWRSIWRRSFDLERYRSAEGRAGGGPGALSSRFFWDRSLVLRWAFNDHCSGSWTSNTNALVDEPFEHQFLSQGEEVRYRLFTDTIMRSIANLGRTYNYNVRRSLNYRLPLMSGRWSRGITGSLRYSSAYYWHRGTGNGQEGRANYGHMVRNNSELDSRLAYRLSDLVPWIEEVSLQGRQTKGSSVPGFALESGPMLGLSRKDWAIKPGLLYRWTLGSQEKRLMQMVDRGELIEDAMLREALTYFVQNEAEGALTITPVKGLRLDLFYSYRQELFGSIDTKSEHPSVRRNGTLSFNHSRLRGFFNNVSMESGGTLDFVEKLREASDKGLGEKDNSATLTQFIGGDNKLNNNGLPRMRGSLPNWSARWDLSKTWPLIAQYLSSLTVTHRYNGSLNVDNFVENKAWIGDNRKVEITSISQRDEMSPIIGLEATTKFGLSIEGRLGKVRQWTLLPLSARLYEQVRDEWSCTASYRYKVPPLFKKSSWGWLRSESGLLTLRGSARMNKDYSMVHNLYGKGSMASAGSVTRIARVSLDYAVSSVITLRGFYDFNSRRPLVITYSYPQTTTNYGVMLQVNLH